MDEGALTEALEVVLARLHEISIATPAVSIHTPGGHSLTEGPLVEELRETNIDYELAKIVLPILEVQPEFKDKAPMINVGSGQFGFQSQFVAPILVREARYRKSAKAAVTWLEKVLGTDSGKGLVIQTLWGISPTQQISLLEDVDLLPFESLPHSRQKERLTDTDWPQSARLPTPFFTQKPPTAALIAKMEVRPFLIDASQKENSTDNSIAQVHPPLDDIRLCLALEGPSIIIPGPGWFQYFDPDLEAALIAVSGSYNSQEIVPLFHIFTDPPEPTTDVQAVVRAYMALKPESIKKKIRIALERLQQALIRSDTADRVLEISIALEALLGDSSGANTFKIPYRAAMLVSENVEERIENRAIIKTAYGIRNALVHTGQSKRIRGGKGQEGKSLEEVASSAATITALVIKRIIMRGGLPEWNRFELSGGRT